MRTHHGETHVVSRDAGEANFHSLNPLTEFQGRTAVDQGEFGARIEQRSDPSASSASIFEHDHGSGHQAQSGRRSKVAEGRLLHLDTSGSLLGDL